jgi:tetratricopeptide (TPR) repeat protein
MTCFVRLTASSNLGWLARIARPLFRPAALVGCVVGLSGLARARDEWIEIKAPHFTIWSEASERRTHDWAVEFELFRRGMEQLIPADERYILPAEIILFRSDRRIRPYLRTNGGQPSKASGYASRQFGRTLIALSIEGARDDVRDLVYGTMLHWHLSGAERQLPPWLELGLAEVFTTFVLHGNSCDIGANREESYRYVRVAGSLPFERLVSLDPQDLGASESEIGYARQVHAQCWAITQALLFTKEGIGWEAFRKYVAAPPAGGTPSAELEHIFGLNASTLDQRLAAYLARGKAERVSATFNRSDIDARFATRRLEPWEKDLVIGSLLTATGRVDEADGYLARAFLASGNDGRVREERAILHLAKNELAEAGREAQQALDAGRRNFFNHYIVASASSEGLAGAEDRGAAPPAISHLLECLALNPRFVPAYELLGGIAPALGTKDTKAGDVLLEGGNRYGGEFPIQAGCALVAARRGNVEAAQRYLAAAKSLVDSSDSKRRKYLTAIESAVAEASRPLNVGLALISDSPAANVTTTSLENTSPEVVRQLIVAIDATIKSRPDASLYYARAALKLRLNDADGALADLAETKRMAPAMVEAYQLGAEVKATKRDFAGVVAEYDAAIASQPNLALLYAGRAHGKANLGNLDGALADYDRSIELDPKSAEYYNNRGYTRRLKADEDGALSDFNRAIELDPKYARAYSNRAAVRGAKGDRQGAVDDLGRAAALKPDSS